MSSMITIGDYVFTGSYSGSIDINSESGFMLFLVGMESQPYIDLGSNPGRAIFIYLLGDNTTFNDALPTQINLSDFSRAFIDLHGDTGPGGPSFSLSGNINTLNTANSIPDASVMWLLGSSLMGLAVFSRKSKRIE